MDFDTFLTSPRWEILKLIIESPLSPIEIAERLQTTVSYVSQQLKLLDAAGLVVKQKTGASLKGKPRTLFGVSKEIFYMVLLTKNFSQKKLLYLTDYHKSILQIWMIEDITLHYSFEMLFWKLQESSKDICALFLENSSFSPKLIIVSNSKSLKLKIDVFSKLLEKKIDYLFVTENQFKKISNPSLFPLFGKFNKEIELKGGFEK